MSFFGVLHAGMQARCGQVIGAAEGDMELKNRHQGFGAYDVPFLGPSQEDQEEAAEVPPGPSLSFLLSLVLNS